MYLVFDEETETWHSKKRKSNPFDLRNWVVMRGWKKQGDPCASMSYHPTHDRTSYLKIDDDVTVLVGHNIKFDLLYEMCQNNPDLHKFFARGGSVWCTQYGEYLIRGQAKKYHMCAMNDIAEKYGGRKKVDGIKELWEAGVLTSQINRDLLEDYLIGTEEDGRDSGDIGNTEKIYLGQLELARQKGMLHSIKRRMDGLLCTTEMEYRGLYVDRKRAAEDMLAFTKERIELLADLDQYIADIPAEVGFNWNSPIHVSCLLFGGGIKYKMRLPYRDDTGELARKKEVERWPLFRGKPADPSDSRLSVDEDGLYYVTASGFYQDRFKNGKKVGEGRFRNVPVEGELKIKWQEFAYDLPGHTTPRPEWKGAHVDAHGQPVYNTNKDVIIELGTRNIPLLKSYSRLAKVDKLLGTYYATKDSKGEVKGMLVCLGDDNLVHHSLNHTSTATSRLSSSNPNCQNIPRAPVPVKGMFVSRFGEDGVMCEIDYSQLEVVVQGLLSNDTNLVKDLNAGLDFHCKRVSNKMTAKGVPLTYDEALAWCKDENHPDYKAGKQARTGCKEFSFQLAYGAGKYAIADTTGMPIEDVELLMELEAKEYPGVQKFNEMVAKVVEASAFPFRDPERGFKEYRRGEWMSPLGTLYTWRTWDAPGFMAKRGIMDTFSPPELKNYPVQGTGGEVVQLVLGLLWRHFVKQNFYDNRAFLINTVHDCVWFDLHKSVVAQVVPTAMKIMQGIPQYLKAFYNVECPVPFPVEAEVGKNMLNMSHFKEEDWLNVA